MTKSEEATVPFLMVTLKEAQDTVRAYDSKAQIVGVGYILAMGIITKLGSRIDNLPDMGVVAVALAWGILILPILLFGSVLYPTRKTAPILGTQGGDAKRVLYADVEFVHDVSAYLTTVDESDLRVEVAYEILKTSGLREIKRRRFLRALWSALASFIVIFLSQLLRAEGLLPL